MDQTVSNTEAPPVRWALHPSSRKFHAFREGVAQSVCGYTAIRLERREAPPAGSHVCRACLSVLKLPAPIQPTPASLPMITRRQSDQERCESYVVEFVGGGPFDGVRLDLDVIREGPGMLRVLEQRHESREKP